MLGRLLRTSSLTEFVPFGGSSVGVTEEVFQNDSCYITDDMKTLLFGTKDRGLFERIANERLHSGGFRLIIAQELGHLTSRNNHQVILDHSVGNFHTATHIPLNELKDYIFGSPIRTIDYSASSDKIKVVKSANMVLFTRIFYFNEKSALRIAISCCVTDDVLPVLTECWPRVSPLLDLCEGSLLKCLAKNDTRFLPKDWKARNCVDFGAVLQTFQRKIIPLLCGYSDPPRLFLYPIDSIPYIRTWIKYVTSWIELKDGPRIRFLTILLAKLRYDFASLLNEDSNTRIVILTGNMNVANRLVFILTAFLGPHFRGPLHRAISTQYCPSPAGRKLSSMSGASDFQFDLKPSNSSITETNKGWEIPRVKRNPAFSVTSVSSDETGVQSFIQPSSLKSGASSVQYLSSSLNSVSGSYGSWFKKAGQSPSSRSNDSSSTEGAATLQRNNSSTSLHQQAVLSNVNVSQRVTPQQSPNVADYDEYPWYTASPVARESPRLEKRFSTSMAPYATDKEKRSHSQSEIYEVDMKRTVNRLVDESALSNAFAELVIDIPKYHSTRANEKHGEVVEVDVTLSKQSSSGQNQELLKRFTSYTPHYNQWFQVQACQITAESEKKIIHSMKRDLTLADRAIHKDNFASTLIISLRSREIKQVTIVKDSNNKFIQRTKKILQNGKVGPVSGTMLSAIEDMEQRLKKLMESTAHDEALLYLFNDLVSHTSS
ncbi:unnamed protein product [Kluyveromyces dobzhanskii CBS 2104]|uniref:Protein LST4 n=1 Tax=Kluyveromyces dobzhanskii CBS 2104 TaxID=1427455 RepID=A0A0A8KYX7_9SACH|nr:unnamed protein product [Kluyveromyces dobzhanskii CBS 2104]